MTTLQLFVFLLAWVLRADMSPMNVLAPSIRIQSNQFMPSFCRNGLPCDWMCGNLGLLRRSPCKAWLLGAQTTINVLRRDHGFLLGQRNWPLWRSTLAREGAWTAGYPDCGAAVIDCWHRGRRRWLHLVLFTKKLPGWVLLRDTRIKEVSHCEKHARGLAKL